MFDKINAIGIRYCQICNKRNTKAICIRCEEQASAFELSIKNKKADRKCRKCTGLIYNGNYFYCGSCHTEVSEGVSHEYRIALR